MQQRNTMNKRAILGLLATAPQGGFMAAQLATMLGLQLSNLTRTLKALVASGDVLATSRTVMVYRRPTSVPYAQDFLHYTLPA
jgi:DNA-binding IclR family transcriptional regulator